MTARLDHQNRTPTVENGAMKPGGRPRLTRRMPRSAIMSSPPAGRPTRLVKTGGSVRGSYTLGAGGKRSNFLWCAQPVNGLDSGALITLTEARRWRHRWSTLSRILFCEVPTPRRPHSMEENRWTSYMSTYLVLTCTTRWSVACVHVTENGQANPDLPDLRHHDRWVRSGEPRGVLGPSRADAMAFRPRRAAAWPPTH